MTQLASTSAAQLSYLEETTYGEVAAGTPKKLRMTGEDLTLDFTMETSKEINASRRAPDSIVTDANAAGSINIGFQYHEYDQFLEALLTGTFDSTFGTGGVKSMTVTFAAGDNSITDDGANGFTGLVAGQWILVQGAADAGNNRWHRISTKTNDKLTLDSNVSTVASESADAVTISSSRLTEGSEDMRSFSIEKAFTDVDQFWMHKGRVPSKLDLNFSTGQILSGSIGFIGATAPRSGVTGFSAPAAAAESFGVMNAVTGVGGLYITDYQGNDLLAGTKVQSMQLSIDAKLRGQKAIGVVGNAGVGLGTFAMTGTMEVYLLDGTIYDEALAQRHVSVTFPVYDAYLNGYAFTLEHCKLGVPKVVAGAMDTDVMLSIPFTVVAPDTTNDRMIAIDRCGVAVSMDS